MAKRNLNINHLFFLGLALLFHIQYMSASEPCFIENKGQWPENVKYYASFGLGNVWLQENKLTFDYFKYERNSIGETIKNGHVISLSFDDNINGKFSEYSETSSKYNYFKGTDKSKWASNVKAYEGLIREKIYNGVSIRYYFDNSGLRYDFMVSPNSDPSQIKISYSGISKDDVESINGEIVYRTSIGNVNHGKIFAFQIIDGIKKEVECKVELNNDEISFQPGEYDKSKALIIDPLVYSTYIGGEMYEQAEDIVIDVQGNAYITGHSASPTFPVTDGAYSEKLKETDLELPDVFVSKFDPTGNNLIFSTFIGGYLDDFGKGIDIDAQGNVYVTGYTGPTGTFPFTQEAYDTSNNGAYDAFVVKFNPDCSELIYSTLIGGRYDDFSQAIKVDQYGSAYIVGYTTELGNYPVSQNAFQQLHHGKYDAFATKLSPDGGELVFSTYLAGNDDDFGEDIAIDSFGIAYIIGTTRSSDFPTTGMAYDKTYSDTSNSDKRGDIFITVLNANASAVQYSTYLGGKGREGGYGITLDDSKNIYITGFSESSDYPVTPGAYDVTYNGVTANLGWGDIVVTKLHKLTDSLVFSTYIGGSGTDRGFDIDLDIYNNCYITGSTGSLDLPITLNTFDSTYNGVDDGSDAFLLRLNKDGGAMSYCSYLGGDERDIVKGIEVFSDFSMFVAGITSSHDFPVSDSAFDPTYNNTNGSDAFLARILPSFLEIDAGGGQGDIIQLCHGDSIQIGSYASGGYGSVYYSWTPAVGLSDSSEAMPYVFPEETTTYTLTAYDESGYQVSDDVIIQVLPAPSGEIIGPEIVLINTNYTYFTEKNENYSYSWSISGGGIVSGQGTSELTVRWTDFEKGRISLTVHETANGCSGSGRLDIIVGDYFKPVIYVDGETEFCEGDSVILDAGAGYSEYNWSTGDTTRYITVKKSGKFWIMVKDEMLMPGISDTLELIVYPIPPSPAIAEVETCLVCLLPNYFYQWYRGDVMIPGADGLEYCPDISGWYRVKISNKIGCYNFSDSIYSEVNSVGDIFNNELIKIYPNPNSGAFTIKINAEEALSSEIRILDILGIEIFKTDSMSNSELFKINLSGHPKGTYVIVIRIGKTVYTRNILYY